MWMLVTVGLSCLCLMAQGDDMGGMPMGNQDPMGMNSTGHGNHSMGDMGGMGNHSNHGNMTGMGGSHSNHSNMGNMTHGNHGNMTHGNHGNMTHGNHGNMDHGNTTGHGDHGNMDHGNMDHGTTGVHGGHSTTGHTQYFYAGVDSIILFEEWVTDSHTKLIGACVAVGVAGMLYEGFKVLREKLLRAATSRKYSKSNGCHLCDCLHILQSLLHVLQVAISYSLMLVFMTFNVWLCLALCLGAGVGYWLFHSKRHALEMGDINEHCN